MNSRASATTLKVSHPEGRGAPARAFGRWHEFDFSRLPSNLENHRERIVSNSEKSTVIVPEMKKLSPIASNGEISPVRANEAENSEIKIVGYRMWMRYRAFNRWYKMKRKKLTIDLPKIIASGVERIMHRAKEIIASGSNRAEEKPVAANSEHHHAHSHHHGHSASSDIQQPVLGIRTHALQLTDTPSNEEHHHHSHHHHEHSHHEHHHSHHSHGHEPKAVMEYEKHFNVGAATVHIGGGHSHSHKEEHHSHQGHKEHSHSHHSEHKESHTRHETHSNAHHGSGHKHEKAA